eukprot:gnl/TRDRNA2_/TRDRNA2_169218_c2_seq1.p1 gnl/TRDRNA2_/TRDRNA2_169218_c2~~gnl/TRDRNA2_/TRDRNA2_169218_c2_seq1.p1  ORF type:complete len:611 (-),score=130.66 gnl/TRDRNA2_/TRDRNA2_169218_c2_seq1:91-1767(-)
MTAKARAFSEDIQKELGSIEEADEENDGVEADGEVPEDLKKGKVQRKLDSIMKVKKEQYELDIREELQQQKQEWASSFEEKAKMMLGQAEPAPQTQLDSDEQLQSQIDPPKLQLPDQPANLGQRHPHYNAAQRAQAASRSPSPAHPAALPTPSESTPTLSAPRGSMATSPPQWTEEHLSASQDEQSDRDLRQELRRLRNSIDATSNRDPADARDRRRSDTREFDLPPVPGQRRSVQFSEKLVESSSAGQSAGEPAQAVGQASQERELPQCSESLPMQEPQSAQQAQRHQVGDQSHQDLGATVSAQANTGPLPPSVGEAEISEWEEFKLWQATQRNTRKKATSPERQDDQAFDGSKLLEGASGEIHVKVARAAAEPEQEQQRQEDVYGYEQPMGIQQSASMREVQLGQQGYPMLWDDVMQPTGGAHGNAAPCDGLPRPMASASHAALHAALSQMAATLRVAKENERQLRLQRGCSDAELEDLRQECEAWRLESDQLWCQVKELQEQQRAWNQECAYLKARQCNPNSSERRRERPHQAPGPRAGKATNSVTSPKRPSTWK